MGGKGSILVVGLIAAATACGSDEIGVSTGSASDYNKGALDAAIDKFVTAKRTPEAFAELGKKVLELRTGMDRTVANEAELKLVVLALAPIQAVAAKPPREQVEALALTVFPSLLAPRIEADAILIKRDARSVELYPRAGETAPGYLQRLCGDVLAGDCRQVVPEQQGAIVTALAMRKGMERARNAVADCMSCTADPGWKEAVHNWEALDRQANGWIHQVEKASSPDNWPIAGNAAEADPVLPEAEIAVTGEVVIGGQRYGGAQRVDALRELRNDQPAIALHMRPESSLAQVKSVLSDAKKAGLQKVAVVARGAAYPWERRIYWLAESGKTRANLRPTDSLQLLLHTIDHVAGPGAIARAD